MSRRSVRARGTRESRLRGCCCSAMPPHPLPLPTALRAGGGEPEPPCPFNRRTRIPLREGSHISPVDLADGAHRLFHPLGVGLPERLELGLVEIVDLLAEIAHRLLELVGGDRLPGF